MTLLHQRLLASQAAEDAGLRDLLTQAVVFKIQNVADYYFSATQDFWQIERDFPNIAPPYPVAWFEYMLPAQVVIGGEQRTFKVGDGPAPQGLRYGYLCVSSESDKPGAKWESVYNVFVGLGEKITSLAAWRVHITETGEVATDLTTGRPLFYLQPFFELTAEQVAELTQQTTSFLHPVLLAVSFLHCKNVTVSEEGGEKRTASGQRRRRLVPLHHTLNIHPMRRVLETEGESAVHGLPRALHICRAHFKNYSKGGGLFGKYQGLYWWDWQRRGNPEHGVSSKDYDVHPPDTES